MKTDQFVDFNKNKKRCNGPLHKGQLVSLERFSIHKGTHRTGKYYNRCRDCINFQRWGETDHGLVEISRVWFVFQELENRLGRAETIRRVGASSNFFWRMDHGHYKHMRMRLVKRAIEVLAECRANGEVRHKHSIKHGSKARGRKERIPRDNHEFYNRYKYKQSGFDRIYNNIEKDRQSLTA